MKKLLTILMLFISIGTIGQITSAKYLNTGATVPFINASSYKLNGTAQTFSQWTTSTTKIYYNTGSVGIGTATPAYPLDVVGIIKTSTYLIQQGIHAGIYVSDASTAQSIANI